jgi:hypothetical protein
MKLTPHISIAAGVLAATAVSAAPAPAAVVRMSPDGQPHRLVRPLAVAAKAKRLPAVSFGGASSQDEPIVMKLAKGRRKATFSVSYDQSCGSGDSGFDWSDVPAVTISKKGAFKKSGVRSMKFDDGWSLVETYRVKGSVGKASAKGTFAVADTWTDPQGQLDSACNSGPVRFSVRDAGILAGTTSDGAPMIMAVSPGLDRVNSAMIPWTARCNSGDWLWGSANLTGPIATGGLFAGTLNRTIDVGSGQQAQEVQTIGGTVTKKRALGSWQVTATVVDSAGANVDACDSGRLKFKLV